MSSGIPAIMTAIAGRLATVPGVNTVYRALESLAHPTDMPASDLPAIMLRITQDALESTKPGKARVQVQIEIDYLLNVTTATNDATLADAVWAMRHALGVEEDTPLDGLLRQGTGIEYGAAIYGYPEPGSQIAIARQPITLHLIETY